MTRKEMYDFVKSHKLEDKIKKETGKNFTNLGNAALEKYCVAPMKTVKEEPKEEKKCERKCNTTKIVVEEPKKSTDNDSLGRLIEVLKNKHILLNSEINYINTDCK